MKEEFRDRLKQARQRAGYETATAGALALGMKQPTYLGYENGDRKPGRKSAERIALGFRVSLDWLLTGKGPPSPAPNAGDPDWVSLHGIPDEDAKTHVRGVIDLLKRASRS